MKFIQLFSIISCEFFKKCYQYLMITDLKKPWFYFLFFILLYNDMIKV